MYPHWHSIIATQVGLVIGVALAFLIVAGVQLLWHHYTYEPYVYSPPETYYISQCQNQAQKLYSINVETGEAQMVGVTNATSCEGPAIYITAH